MTSVDVGWICDCGRGDVAVYLLQTRSSLTVRRLQDVPHPVSDGRCIDCVADAASEVSSFVRETERSLAAARNALAAVREVRAERIEREGR